MALVLAFHDHPISLDFSILCYGGFAVSPSSVLEPDVLPDGHASVHGRIPFRPWNVSRNTRGVLRNDRNLLTPKVLVPGGGVEPPRGVNLAWKRITCEYSRLRLSVSDAVFRDMQITVECVGDVPGEACSRHNGVTTASQRRHNETFALNG